MIDLILSIFLLLPSDQLIVEMKKQEGFSSTPYYDIGGTHTIGYGFANTNLTFVTERQATELLRAKTNVLAWRINAKGYNLNQNQLDALVDFAYNVGVGGVINNPRLDYAIRNKNDDAIKHELRSWAFVKGQKIPALVRRREFNINMFFKPVTKPIRYPTKRLKEIE